MRIAFLGDVALIGRYDTEQNSLESVLHRFSSIVPIFQECDYVVANLESPLTDKKKTGEFKTLALRSALKNIEVLKRLGINVVSLANNHTYDYGTQGLSDTITALKDSGIQYYGIDREPLVLNKGNDKVLLDAFCCLTTNAWHYDIQGKNGRLNTLTKEALEKTISRAKQENAYPIISNHWGEENTHYPRREHLYLMDELLANSKVTVIGHHPHVLQGIKTYNNGLVAFSLGNFCFDDYVSDKSNLVLHQMPENLKSMICIVDYSADGGVNYEYIFIRDNGQSIEVEPQIMDEVSIYSSMLYGIDNVDKYDDIRRKEQSKAQVNRLGKRDFKWLLGHMNLNAVMSVLQRKNNQKQFRKISDSYCEGDYRDAIVYVGNFDRPEMNAAGKRVYGNALILRDLGYKVVLVGKSKEDNPEKCYTSEICEGITYVSFPNIGMLRATKYITWFHNYLKRNRIHPICYFRYGSPTLAIFDWQLLKSARKGNIPVVADVVDWLSADGGSFIFNIIKTVDTWLEKAWLNKKSDGIVVISRYLEKYYKKSVKHVTVIPPVVEKYQKPQYSGSDKTVLVYAGAPFRKGIEVKDVHKIKDRLDLTVQYVAEAVESGANLVFKIYGVTHDEYTTAFPKHKPIVESYGDNIQFFGRVPMKAVQEEVNRADFTILLREKTRATMAGFPTKVVESMSCGTPVITTSTTDLPLYINNGVNGFFVDIDNKENALRDLALVYKLSSNEKDALKENCFETKAFEYNVFKDQVKEFLKSLDI